MDSVDDRVAERRRMVESLKREGYAESAEVERAMLKVPRHFFLPVPARPQAYIDTPLQIGEGQTISAPHMVAIMCERLRLAPGMKVLEIGAGSGYHAAVVAEIVGEKGRVFTVERIRALAASARESLALAGYGKRVYVAEGDGTLGLAAHAPYDRIYVTAASPGIPGPLVGQLREGGILLVPVGERHYQELIAVKKIAGGLETENHGGCVFVPLIGEYGH